jgi:hypothetical protein
MSIENTELKKYYAVIYQFGKVASTSIVNSLNDTNKVTAVQSHFLGEKNLKQMVDMFVDVKHPKYFFDHNIGQFLHNLQVTRSIYEFRDGLQKKQRLLIISLSRDPLEWLRSSVSQDIVGYLGFLESVAQKHDIATEDKDSMIERVLPLVLSEMDGALDRVGGVDAFLRDAKPWRKALPASGDDSLDRHFRNFLAMTLRPFEWFETHFESLLGISVTTLAPIAQNLLHRDTGWCDIFVLRYEDMAVSMRVIVERLEVQDGFALSKDNVSADKKFAGAISQAFKSETSCALRARFRDSAYARRFGY